MHLLPEYATQHAVSIPELLASRDERQARQQEDIDVLTPEGEILSRRHFALPARRCLLCEQSAADCARGKTHALSDLLTQMEALLHDADSRNINQ